MPRARSLATSLPFEDGNERNRTGPRLERERERASYLDRGAAAAGTDEGRATGGSFHSKSLCSSFSFSFLFFFFSFLACASLFACDHVDLVRNAKKLKWASICRMTIPVVSYYN